MKSLSLPEIRKYPVPAGSVALWWLGQLGFIVKSPGGKIVALDPYLTNSCKALGEQLGFNLDRLVPPPLAPADLVGIDLYVMTHSHQDHLDPETLEQYRAAGGKGPYLAPAEAIEKLHSLGVPCEQTNMVWPNKTFPLGDLTIRATFAIPFSGNDLTHVGYLMFISGGPTIYFTGDTAYHDLIAVSVAEHKPDVMATVINGAWRNLSPGEAAFLAKQVNAKIVIPCHHDLFLDNIQPPQMLRTNLHILGLAERYRSLEHGKPYLFEKE